MKLFHDGAGRSKRPGAAKTEKQSFVNKHFIEKHRFFTPGPVGAAGRERPGAKQTSFLFEKLLNKTNKVSLFHAGAGRSKRPEPAGTQKDFLDRSQGSE